MAIRRRWLQFSLRGLLALVTVFAILLGWQVERASKERGALDAIRSLGGDIRFYNQQTGFEPNKPTGSTWLLGSVGDDIFAATELAVIFFPLPYISEEDIVDSIPHLKRVRELRTVLIYHYSLSQDAKDKITSALPRTEVVFR